MDEDEVFWRKREQMEGFVLDVDKGGDGHASLKSRD